MDNQDLQRREHLLPVSSGDDNTLVRDLVPNQEEIIGGDDGALARAYYSFKSTGEAPCLNDDKGLRENLLKWGMSEKFSVAQTLFAPALMPHEETSFIRQLLTFVEQETLQNKVQRNASIESVQWEALSCTAVSMEFFDCLSEKGIVGPSGRIRGCYDEVFDGVTVSDKLRELLVNPEPENADLVFSMEQKRELLFHMFKALCIGGAVCQADDRLEAYTEATKILYKDLVSVRRSKKTSSLEISPCKVYRITGINGHDDQRHRDKSNISNNSPERELFPNAKNPESPHHVCLVVVDLGKKRASVLRKEFVPFW